MTGLEAWLYRSTRVVMAVSLMGQTLSLARDTSHAAWINVLRVDYSSLDCLYLGVNIVLVRE